MASKFEAGSQCPNCKQEVDCITGECSCGECAVCDYWDESEQFCNQLEEYTHDLQSCDQFKFGRRKGTNQ